MATSWPNGKVMEPRRWAKFGACANAQGPERGITMQCGRRKPVEFTWTLSEESKKNSLEQISRMKESWLHYRPQAVNEFQKPSESIPANADPRSSPPRTSSKGETNSRAGKTWSPIDEQRRRNEHQVAPPGLMAPQELKKFPTNDSREKLSEGAAYRSSPQKARAWKTGSTLHTDAAEFIPQTAQSSTDAREQPVQWLNNDIHRPNEPNEHPFTLPDKSAEQLPHPQHGPMDHGPMGDAFSRQSRDVGPNALNGKTGMDQDTSADVVRRNAQLIHMKTKLKEHYRLLYSKYKEYVGKRVPEKVEEYYMRLKHCQAQYMKLKYYEYKAAHMSRPNEENGVPPPQSAPNGAQQRGGPSIPGIPSRMENGRIPIPDNNPWQSQNGRGGGGGGGGGWKDGGDFGMGYGSGNPMHNDWGGPSESMWRGGSGAPGQGRSKPNNYQHAQRENGGYQSKYSGMGKGTSMWGGDGYSRGNSGPHAKIPPPSEFSERRGGGGHRGGFGGPMFEPESNSYGHGHRGQQDGGGWSESRNGYSQRDNGRFAGNGPNSAPHNPRWNS